MPGKPKIFVSEAENFSPEAAQTLGTVGELVLADVDRPQLLQDVSDCDVLWVRLRHQIDAEVMQHALRLRFIVTPTTGLNHVDLAEAQRRGIRVVSLRGEIEFLKEVRATAELTVGLMLSLMRRIPQATDHVKVGNWNRDEFRGSELHNKVAGVVGYGRLGRIVARYLRAFDMQVLACDPHVEASETETGVQLVEMNTLLSSCDVVTLHVNLNETTEGFFGRAQFEKMKPGAYFINTARGELVDENALLDVLVSGQLAGAALDVLSGESSSGMANHPLVNYARSRDNLLITPHIGGCTHESMPKTERFLAGRLVEILQAENP